MRFHLVRHGETDWNAGKRIQGTIDIDLNDNGRRQALELGATLQAEGIVFVGLVTSTQKRARSTAEILEASLGLKATGVPGLHEMDFGQWQGLTWAEVEDQYPNEFTAWLNNRRTTPTPGGESYDQVLNRTLRTLAGLAGPPGDLLVVTHGAVMLSLRSLVAGVDFGEMDKFRVGNLERFVLDEPALLSWAGAYGFR